MSGLAKNKNRTRLLSISAVLMVMTCLLNQNIVQLNYGNEISELFNDISNEDYINEPAGSDAYPVTFIHVDGNKLNNWSDTADLYDWCHGSGTKEDPYIIENVTVDTGNTRSGIFIENSDVHFIIRNCTVKNSILSGIEAGIKFNYVDNGRIEFCKIHDNYNGIYFQSFCNDNIIHNNSIHSNSFFGMYAAACENNIITNNYIAANSDDGIRILSNSDYNVIFNNTIFDNGDSDEEHGLLLSANGSHNNITGNFFEKNYDSGISIQGNDLAIVKYNKMVENGDNGMQISGSGSKNNLISNNNISQNTNNGIYMYTMASQNTISENQIVLNGDDGIRVDTDCYNSIISNNNVSNNANKGIRIRDCGDFIIRYNNISFNHDDGIQVQENSDNITIQNNHVNNNSQVGIDVVAASENNTISSNFIMGNGFTGLRLISSVNKNNVSKNIIKYNKDDGINVSSFCYWNTFRENMIVNNTGVGIHVDGTSGSCHNNTIIENTIEENRDYNIFVDKSDGIRIIENDVKNAKGAGNDDGICLQESDYTRIIRNNVSRNTEDGIRVVNCIGVVITENIIQDHTSGSSDGINVSLSASDTRIFKNAFINNNRHAYDRSTNSKWNNSYVGNYWDDHVSTDWNKNGTCDDPYSVPGTAGTHDYKPIFRNPISNGSNIHIDATAGLDIGAYNWTWARTRLWCSGKEGTFDDPYIISDLKIDADGSGSCLIIGNSTKFFQIEDCLLSNSGSNYDDAGITLISTSNGTLTNNNCSNNNEDGICLRYCENITISQNLVSYNTREGIHLRSDCFNNTIFRNTVKFNGGSIRLRDGCKNNTIRSNMILGTDVQQGISLTESQCDNNTIRSNTIIDCTLGIYFYQYCSGNKVINNTISSSYTYGIEISSYCEYNFVINNDITYSVSHGIYLGSNTNGNKFYNNLIEENQGYGMRTTSSTTYSLIFNNTFITNALGNAFQQGGTNFWNNSIMGNRWDDYTGLDEDVDGIGDVSYTFPTSGEDYKPIAWNGAIKWSYWNRRNITINDIETGIGAHDWAWAETQPWCKGSGTEEEPYLIENGVLNGLNNNFTIKINNSRKYFVIQNCSLFNTSIAIHLTNISNGILFNNTIYNLEGKIGKEGSIGSDNNPGEQGGDGTNAIGIFAMNCTKINTSNNVIKSILGGIGGRGGEGGAANSLPTAADGGNGGLGGDVIGIFYNQTLNSYIINNTIFNITGGKGGDGGLGGDGSTESHGGLGGSGGKGGFGIAIKIQSTSKTRIELNQLHNITGGRGGDGGNGGLEGLGNEGDGGDGGDGNLGGGIYLEKSKDVNKTFIVILNITGGDGGDCGTGYSNGASGNPDGGVGIFMKLSNSSMLCESNISLISDLNNRGEGVRLNYSTDNLFIQNGIFNCSEGIYLYQSKENNMSSNDIKLNDYGIFLKDYSSNNSIVDNNVNNNSQNGIEFDGDCANNTISLNRIHNNSGNGISCQNDVKDNTFINNFISGNYHGISLSLTSDRNIIQYNNITNNLNHGLQMIMADNNIVNNNTLKNNSKDGINLNAGSVGNNFTNNLIKNSEEIGINVESVGCHSNLFYNNSFIGNKQHIYNAESNNEWNSSIIGNFWDNYTGYDDDGDRIGEKVHDFPGGTDFLPICNIKGLELFVDLPANNSFQNNLPRLKIRAQAPNLNCHKIWYNVSGNSTKIFITSSNNSLIDLDQYIWAKLDQGSFNLSFYANITTKPFNVSKKITLVKDTIQPSITINYPADETSWTEAPVINITVKDKNFREAWYEVGSDMTRYYLTNNTEINFDADAWEDLEVGEFYIIFYIRDWADNYKSVTHYLTKEKTSYQPSTPPSNGDDDGVELVDTHFWELNPIIIDDEGTGDYTWSQATAQAWCSGTGTKADPYLIENVTIIWTEGESYYCLLIRNSDSFFIIRNCTMKVIVIASSSSSELIPAANIQNNVSGIMLDNVDNAVLDKNTCSGLQSGIKLMLSDSNNISSNNITGNYYGIYMDSSDDNRITFNSLTNNEKGIEEIGCSGTYKEGNQDDNLERGILDFVFEYWYVFIIAIGAVMGISGLVVVKKRAVNKEASEEKPEEKVVEKPLKEEKRLKKKPIKEGYKKKVQESEESKIDLTDEEKADLAKTEQEVDVEEQKIICIVHKGPIVGANIYVCPKCKAFYCVKCATFLKESGEKCWSCNADIQL